MEIISRFSCIEGRLADKHYAEVVMSNSMWGAVNSKSNQQNL